MLLNQFSDQKYHFWFKSQLKTAYTQKRYKVSDSLGKTVFLFS